MAAVFVLRANRHRLHARQSEPARTVARWAERTLRRHGLRWAEPPTISLHEDAEFFYVRNLVTFKMRGQVRDL